MFFFHYYEISSISVCVYIIVDMSFFVRSVLCYISVRSEMTLASKTHTNEVEANLYACYNPSDIYYTKLRYMRRVSIDPLEMQMI